MINKKHEPEFIVFENLNSYSEYKKLKAKAMTFTPKEKKTIEETKLAIDNLITCFAKHPSVDLENFRNLRAALENMGETLSVADDINDILGI